MRISIQVNTTTLSASARHILSKPVKIPVLGLKNAICPNLPQTTKILNNRKNIIFASKESPESKVS